MLGIRSDWRRSWRRKWCKGRRKGEVKFGGQQGVLKDSEKGEKERRKGEENGKVKIYILRELEYGSVKELAMGHYLRLSQGL